MNPPNNKAGLVLNPSHPQQGGMSLGGAQPQPTAIPSHIAQSNPALVQQAGIKIGNVPPMFHPTLGVPPTGTPNLHASNPSSSTALPNLTATQQLAQTQEEQNEILTKRKLQDLVTQISPTEKLDPDVEDLILEVADDFIESVTTFACNLAKHRGSTTLEVKDVVCHLERNWGIRIPGFGNVTGPGTSAEFKGKKVVVPEAHKQRINMVKRSAAILNAQANTTTTTETETANKKPKSVE
eukprot:TRINITY_DN1599_c0_g1_i1.p1 TRINITY_DN1599_c0_g1~~TRINITY_DN1599_c0_g1_i1.p1  ORF type:complete len:239 (+),score=63.72 TRINITY_DN1599_c0_g1_i1:131-847(+)